jgi:hypothetical protein
LLFILLLSASVIGDYSLYVLFTIFIPSVIFLILKIKSGKDFEKMINELKKTDDNEFLKEYENIWEHLHSRKSFF